MLQELDALIKKYEEKIVWIVNPDGFETWEEIGFDKKPDDYDSIFEFLKNEEDMKFENRIELGCYEEMLEDLKELREKHDK